MARGFIFCDDFTGAIVRYMGDDMVIPFIWIKAYEGGTGDEANDFDVDYYALDPVFNVGDIKINPHLMYIKSADAQNWSSTNSNEAVDVYYLGASVDYAADMFSVWFTGILSQGSVDLTTGDSVDVASNLFAVGGSFSLDALTISAEAFMASGDDDATDDEANDFYVPKGRSYYWAEIMGYGTIDQQVSAGSPADQVSNITAINVGVDIPMDKLNLAVDIWNANLIEDDANGETALGTEIDVTASYQLLDDLKLTVIAAYLSAGEATGGGDENPTEIGAQLSLSF
jgi:hypothetical protein